MKVEEYDEIFDEYSYKEKEMSLFVKRYSGYIKKHRLKHYDNNVTNFKNSYPYKKSGNKNK